MRILNFLSLKFIKNSQIYLKIYAKIKNLKVKSAQMLKKGGKLEFVNYLGDGNVAKFMLLFARVAGIFVFFPSGYLCFRHKIAASSRNEPAYLYTKRPLF